MASYTIGVAGYDFVPVADRLAYFGKQRISQNKSCFIIYNYGLPSEVTNITSLRVYSCIVTSFEIFPQQP